MVISLSSHLLRVAAQASLAFDIMLLPESAFGGIGKLYEANVNGQAPVSF